MERYGYHPLEITNKVRKKLSKNLKKGKKGETLAVAYLEAKGYDIMQCNYRSGKSEIDIIATDGKFLVFVEVKFRTGQAYGFPEAAVDAKKAKLITRAAEKYIYDIDWKSFVRFDVISILNGEIEHFEDAFC